MGFRELINALRKEGDEKIMAIWHEAETEAERIRADAANKIAEMIQQHSRMQALSVKEQTYAILLDSEKKARIIRLQSERELSMRLYQLAVDLIHVLRDERYSDVFDRLVQELPVYKWAIVRVGPEDVEMAVKYFSDSEIIPDSSITGGLEAIAEGGKIKVVNTFEKRLERCWPEMLPELIHDVRCMMD